MPTDRFLIQFDTNVTAAMRALDQLAAKITQIESRLNALNANAARAGGGGVFGGVGQQAQQASQSVAGLSNNVATATQRLSAIKAGGATGIAAVGTAAKSASSKLADMALQAESLAQFSLATNDIGGMRRAGQALQFVANSQTALGQSATKAQGQVNQLTTAINAHPSSQAKMRAAVDASTDSFGRHIKRIEETIFAYTVFFGAIAALTKSFDLATTIDRESRRLEAVLDITPELAGKFVGGLADIAVETVTPLEDLVSEADFMASAFADVEDPVLRAADALELANQVGRVTTVTQRDVATETANLISIMKQANIPIDELGDVLGRITVAGNNSSTAIGEILDALQGSTAAAQVAGVDLNTLIALIAQFRQSTQRSGTEIGNTFKTLFQSITNDEAQNHLKELTNGLVDVRDAGGNIRSVTAIMLDLVNVAKAFPAEFTQAKLNEIFKALSPQLQPGAAKDLQILFDTFKSLGPIVDEVTQGTEKDLTDLVTQINQSLGPQIKKFVEEVKRGFEEVFAPELLRAGASALEVFEGVRDAIAQIPTPILVMIAKFAAFLGILRAGSFVLRGFVALLGLGGLAGAANAAATTTATFTVALEGEAVAAEGAAVATAQEAEAAGAAGVASAGAAGGVTVLGRAFTGLAGAAIGLLSKMGPLLAVFAALQLIEFASNVGAEAQGLSEQIGDLAGNAAGLDQLIAKLEALKAAGQGDPFSTFFKGLFVDPGIQRDIDALKALREQQDLVGLSTKDLVKARDELSGSGGTGAGGFINRGVTGGPSDVQNEIDLLDALIAARKEANNTEPTTFSDFINAALGITTAAGDTKTAVDSIVTSFDQLNSREAAAAQAMASMTSAQRIAAEASGILSNLVDDQATAYQTLDDRLRSGDITQRQWTEGQGQVQQAARLASQLVAAQGDALRTMIPELGGAAEGNDALAAAIFDMMIKAGDSLPLIANQVQRIVALAGSSNVAATQQQQLAVKITDATRAVLNGTGPLSAVISLTAQYAATAAAAAAAITAWAQAQTALGSTFAAIREGTGATLSNALAQLNAIGTGTNVAGNIAASVAAAVGAIRNALAGSGNTIFGTAPSFSSGSGGSGGSGSKTPKTFTQTPIVDIEPLTKGRIAEIIRIAERIRNRVPGGRQESKGDIVSLLRDGRFLRNVKGVDERFLRIAIDRLTKQMEKANEIAERNAQRDGLLTNLVVNQGPLGALVSQPTAFGVAGSLAAGSGLNFNPAKGNFVINVPVQLKGLNPAALQQLIYNIIAKAIRDALRL